MRLKKLKLTNIRSYENLEIEFPKGAILLSGDIGAGKTSILLALQFALFGLQPGQKGASLIRNGTNEASVSLEIEIDGKSIILERALKKSKNNSISQDFNQITIDNVKEEISTSEMKNKVITLLDYPKEFLKKSNLLYKFTVYTPQEAMKEIIQERPEIRLDTLRHIFGIDRYKRIKENSQIFLQKIKEAIKIKEVEITELNRLKENFVQENENKIQLSREINNLNIEFQNLAKLKQESDEKISSFQKLIEEKRKLDSEITSFRITLEGKKDMKLRYEKEILSMQKQVQKIDFSQDKLEAVIQLLNNHKSFADELNSKYMAIISNISVLNSKKEQAFQLKEKVSALENCPTCFQSVSHEHKDKITKRTQYDIEEVDRELEQKLFQKTQTMSDIEKEKKLISDYESDKSNLERDKIKFEYQKTIETKIKSDAISLERTQLEINEIKEKIINLEGKIPDYKETELIFEQHKKQADIINSNVRQKEIILAEKNKELEILKKQLENLQNQITKKETIRTQVNYLRQLQDWIQEKFLAIITLTETNVMAKLRSEFSKIFSEWFSILVSNSLQVRLDEDFTPIISNQDYEIDYDFLSGGERTAVALAYRLALNQVLNSLLSRIKTKGLVILDEPTDGFSEQQLDKMRDIFDQLQAEQLILVSHEQKIEGFVDHVIRIKKDGFSCVESVSG